MLDITKLKAKIESLKIEVLPDSISPLRLGTILEEMLDKLHIVYQGDLSQDIEDAFNKVFVTLEKADTALEVLRLAIAELEKAAVIHVVDRGIYDPAASYFFESLNPDTGKFETSDVWYFGCRYRCLVTGTSQPPIWSSSDWLLIEGNSDFTAEFEPVNTVVSIRNVDIDLKLIARLHNVDVTADILDVDIVWSRYSEDADGAPRTLSDNAWTQNHRGAGKSVHISLADLDYNGKLPKVIRFMATATLRDGVATAALSLTNL